MCRQINEQRNRSSHKNFNMSVHVAINGTIFTLPLNSPIGMVYTNCAVHTVYRGNGIEYYVFHVCDDKVLLWAYFGEIYGKG